MTQSYRGWLSRSRNFALLAAAVLGFTVVGTSPVAADPDPRLLEGQQLYRQYCGACHGLTAEGDGVVSGFMNPRPTDLTIAARQHQGDYPFKKLMDQTDGTTKIRAHGDPDMPVWGEVLREPTHQDGERRADVQGRTFLIVKYLESIQKK